MCSGLRAAHCHIHLLECRDRASELRGGHNQRGSSSVQPPASTPGPDGVLLLSSALLPLISMRVSHLHLCASPLRAVGRLQTVSRSTRPEKSSSPTLEATRRSSVAATARCFRGSAAVEAVSSSAAEALAQLVVWPPSSPRRPSRRPFCTRRRTSIMSRPTCGAAAT